MKTMYTTTHPGLESLYYEKLSKLFCRIGQALRTSLVGLVKSWARKPAATSHDGVHLRPSHFGILTDRRQLADHHPPTNNHTKVKPRVDQSLKSVVASLQHVYRSSDNRASRIPVHSAEQPRCKYALITLGHMWPTNTTTIIGVFDSTNCKSRLLAFS